MSPSISRRVAPLSGLAFFLLVMVGNSIATGDSNVGRGDSAEKILAYIRAHDGAAWWIGTALEIAGLLLLGVFAVYTVRRIRSAGVDGRLPAIALAGGLGTVALKLVSGGPAVYAVVRSNEISAGTAKTLVSVNDWMFVASWIGIGAFVAAGGIGAARAGLLPRPLGIAGAVFAALIAVGAAAGVEPGIFGYLLSLLWIAVVSVVFAVRQRRARVAVPVPATA
ncbi:MAG: hypothetical protein QOJ12_3159 [Thermoleophilales bacterium]|nr:hypothetical protein [Thermoleophilales bacterium]